MSLLITIFLLVFIAQVVTWVGKTVLLDIVGVIFDFSTAAAKAYGSMTHSGLARYVILFLSCCLPCWHFCYNLYLWVTRSPLAARQRALKTEILSTKSELLKTSAQDQFAKWAKLRRSVDKGLADLEKLNAEIASSRNGFAMKFNTLLWVSTTGLQFVVTMWYRKQPVFYLPEGWLGPVTWWLSLPFAPAGSVSVGVWQMACKRVITIGERVVKDFIGSDSPELGSEKVAMPSMAPTPNNTPRKETLKERKNI